MPFGLASLPLQIMAFGLDLLLRTAEWTAGLGAHSGAVPIPDATTTFLVMAALFGLVLIPGKLKYVCVLPFSAAVISAVLSRPPDVQIADKGQLIAARDEGGIMRFHAGRAGFVTDNWLQVEGLPEKVFEGHRMAAPQFACDENGCIYRAYPEAMTVKTEPLLLALPKTADCAGFGLPFCGCHRHGAYCS